MSSFLQHFIILRAIVLSVIHETWCHLRSTSNWPYEEVVTSLSNCNRIVVGG